MPRRKSKILCYLIVIYVRCFFFFTILPILVINVEAEYLTYQKHGIYKLLSKYSSFRLSIGTYEVPVHGLQREFFSSEL